MEMGFILDRANNGANQARWIAGKPERGFFGLKMGGKRWAEIQTYRCTACGFLESYANDPV
jgi:hypothetical protein